MPKEPTLVIKGDAMERSASCLLVLLQSILTTAFNSKNHMKMIIIVELILIMEISIYPL